jgi:hypothetical protein
MYLINALMFIGLFVAIIAIVNWISSSTKKNTQQSDEGVPSPMITHDPIRGMQTNETAVLDATKPYQYLTSPFFPVISRLLNKAGYKYNVSHNGNRFILEFQENEDMCVVVIETHPVDPIIGYKSLIIRDFPDDRLLKLTELIVRLNPHFIYGRFDMLMEERFIIFDMPYRPPFENLDPNKHEYCIQAVIDAWKRCHKIIHDVAFSDTEPVVAMMELEA